MVRRLSRNQNGGWENMVSWRNGFENGDYGIPQDPNGLYGTQEAFGKASFPQNTLKKWFSRFVPVFGKLGRAPLAPCVSPMGPLWAHRSLFPLFGVPSQDHLLMQAVSQKCLAVAGDTCRSKRFHTTEIIYVHAHTDKTPLIN